jgi:hypothetical protein
MASVAGVGLVALAQPSEAKIVYTFAHRVIPFGDVYQLDLNHDGVPDFTLQQQQQNRGHSSTYRVLSAIPANGALLMGHVSHVQTLTATVASALPSGVQVGPRESSSPMHLWSSCENAYICLGTWLNVSNRYLGLKFTINGQVHYGWARFNVKVLHHGGAYRTTLSLPAMPTRQFQTSRSSLAKPKDRKMTMTSLNRMHLLSMPARQTATLGVLALGAPALSIWRRGGYDLSRGRPFDGNQRS